MKYLMSKPENQDSVYEWIESGFPGASMERRITHLYDEVTELAVSLNTKVDLEKIISVIRHSWEKAQSAPAEPKGEIADVRISLIGIASAAGINEQEALDDKMEENRARTLEATRAREAGKQELKLY